MIDLSKLSYFKRTVFNKSGLPRFLKILALEDSLASKVDTTKYSKDSPTRFDIPVEYAKREGIEMPIRLKIMPDIISSLLNMRKSLLEIEKNPQDPLKSITRTEFDNLEKYASSLNVSGIGYTKVPKEYIFAKKAIIYDNAIVLAMNMDNEKISKAPSKKALKNIWMTYNKLGIAANKIARYLRNKGYSTQASHPLGGLVLYPRLAAKAGLGSFGKSGLLITPINGSTLRLAAIYTSIENLPFNKGNKHTWVRDYCDQCNKCIKECPPKAIYNTPIVHENGRVTHIDNNKCFPFFGNNFGCSICIKVCPFNRSSYDDLKKSFEKIKNQ